MRTLNVRNVNDALPQALDMLMMSGHERDSRAGRVRVMTTPVTTVYHRPEECVLLWSERDANPFFHLYEAAYMLTGSNRLRPLRWFVKRMEEFSDDGQTLQGFYGARWRRWFGRDQLVGIVDSLKKNPEDRRCVLQMWDARTDLCADSADVPCNTGVYFSINVSGKLDMTVTNRSNDVVWGAYGANAVHMSLLQQYIAAWVGVPVGHYWQISNNFHGYLDTMDDLAGAARDGIYPFNPYSAAAGTERVAAKPLLCQGESIEAVEAMDRFAASVQNVKDRVAELVATSPAISRFFEGAAVLWEQGLGHGLFVS